MKIANSCYELRRKLSYFYHVKVRCLPFNYRTYKRATEREQYKIIGIIRERNESLLLQDSLDHLAATVDAIIVFDDDSTDDSLNIARNHPKVIEVIKNKKWKKNNRVWEETANRHKLLMAARKYKPDWIFYCDADERFEGDIRDYLLNKCPDNIKALRISLFDAYITKNDNKPFEKGQNLKDFRKYFGIERRDILMIWRNRPHIDFRVPDAREPQGIKESEKGLMFYCQHYGKSLSVEQWDETCRYYIDYFPKYSEKWRLRLGKAIHEKSDFNTDLYTWDEVKEKAVRI